MEVLTVILGAKPEVQHFTSRSLDFGYHVLPCQTWINNGMLLGHFYLVDHLAFSDRPVSLDRLVILCNDLPIAWRKCTVCIITTEEWNVQSKFSKHMMWA